MAITHAVASGMGGMRAAGDLVARMQIARGMKIDEAKKRDDLGLGILHPNIRSPKCLEAKFNIARLLDIEINCVNRFKEKAGL
jgi:dimethylamine--corrinoid protein Co-methyltransferase